MSGINSDVKWTEDLIEFGLQEALSTIDDHTGLVTDEISSIRTFKEANLLTYKHGLVIRMCDGSEFQVTIFKKE